MKNININTTITDENIDKAMQVLIDNGIEASEADTVLQAIGYTLLNTELFEDNSEDEENDDSYEDVYNDSPEYVHDAALDWFYDHADNYSESEIENGDPIMDCEDALREEGYNIDNPECREAVHDAYDDFLMDR